MADTQVVKITKHRSKTPQNCARCRNQSRAVEAEWNVTAPEEKMQYMCTPHARYWAAQHGVPDFPADK